MRGCKHKTQFCLYLKDDGSPTSTGVGQEHNQTKGVGHHLHLTLKAEITANHSHSSMPAKKAGCARIQGAQWAAYARTEKGQESKPV